MWFLPLVWLACSPDPAPEVAVAPAAADVYLEGMWAQRALTVQAGLEEALLHAQLGEKDRALAAVDAVMAGSFRPELEPLLREQVDPRLATELEFRFGVLREALRGGDAARAQAALTRLGERLQEGAGALDQKRAVMR